MVVFDQSIEAACCSGSPFLDLEASQTAADFLAGLSFKQRLSVTRSDNFQ